ncbi:TonB-dependent receptor [Stenotrophomonas sp. Nf1]|nr:TonB-dependent receptor [Stenotrophomonas sp. Nf1]PTA77478.1 TonB-dependent receptor [Stenotrophomonas sp. Nf4]
MRHPIREAAAAAPLAKRLSRAVHAVLIGGLAVLPVDAMAEAEESDGDTRQQLQQLDTVTVTGSYARSLERAVDLKRANIGFSDSIVATDVADFPEQNLAEALQRMPGVTIERNKGLGSKVSVRGLPSEFTLVSINNLATASGSGGRDVQFDIFTADVVQTVTVQKSPTAADEEGGIAGSVYIETAKPFDYAEPKFSASAEASHNSINDRIDPKISFLASDTWGDWGGLVSFSKAKRSNRTDSNSGINFRPMGRFLEASGTRSSQAAAVLARDVGIAVKNRMDKDETSRIIFQDKVGDRVYLNEQDQWGATASLQFKPSATFSLSFDAMLGGYDTHEDEYDAAAYSASSRSTLDRIYDYDRTTLGAYGITVLKDVAYTATQHEILSKDRNANTDYRQFSSKLDWTLAGWDIDALVGYSGARRDSDYANLKHVAYAPSRTRWTGKGGETVPSSAGGFDMYNAASKYLFEAYETELEKVSDDKYAAQLDLRRQMNLAFFPALSAVQFGARYTDKTKQREFGSGKIQGPSAGSTAWVNTRTLADSHPMWISQLAPGGAYRPSELDWQQISNAYARATFRYPGYATSLDPGQFYEVKEKTLALYAMADFYFDIGHVPVYANLGVRSIDTDVDSSGFHPVQKPDGSSGFTATPISSSGDYSKILPSFNITAEIAEGLVLRGSASETLMRPSLTDIAYRRTVSWSSFRFMDGNPALKPTTAKQWEIGVEKYLHNGGLLAASYFSKEIDGVVRQSLTGIERNVEKLNANGSLDGYYDFEVYQPVNADGSYKVSGVELVAQLPLSMLHPALEGWGINANYTQLDNSLTGASDLSIPTPPEGLAEKAYNFTLYYENDRFSARASYNYKDKYVEYIHLNMYPVYRDAYGQLDASIGFRLNDTWKLNLEAINLLDEATRGYTIDKAFPTQYEFSGRRVTFGIRADF